jgi:hypothetical protein
VEEWVQSSLNRIAVDEVPATAFGTPDINRRYAIIKCVTLIDTIAKE